VDKANVPEYDVSAILYLSDGTPEPRDEDQRRTTALLTTAQDDISAAEFSGGTLDFLDDDAALYENVKKLKQKETHTTFLRRVTPRRGRLVVFASGEENVHAVGSVTSGARATLNLWLTFDEGLEVKL
jgi:Rps23 Pro-64 3,4-dihydroxylase Tpa1-like proline 4-hydroxylase